ncbi:MAG: hypothetical protein D4R56_05265 [Deltaproteobacteria bacterium]|nr:MAG: hypothetical protein D4R56_05265 [Deltaproteobacteria bacterium]
MTNTLHRQGKAENLKNDYVVFMTTAAGINREGSAPEIQEFMRICHKYHPINMGNVKLGNIYKDGVDVQEFIANLGEGAGSMAVFTDLDTVQKVVEELIQADLGISINISGLLDEVRECCRKAGITRHSAEHSLGFWGARERLPERETLEINTLCGHGMISFNLIRKMVEYVKLRRLTPKKAARILAKCCECGVFNPERAEKLLEKIKKGEVTPSGKSVEA